MKLYALVGAAKTNPILPGTQMNQGKIAKFAKKNRAIASNSLKKELPGRIS